MSSDLVLQMRTCAAAMLANSGNNNTPFQRLYGDAARLLTEASNLLDVPEPLGEPMQVLEAARKEANPGAPTWTAAGELPAAVPRPCPQCAHVGARKVRIAGKRLMLTCSMCAHEWEYAP